MSVIFPINTDVRFRQIIASAGQTLFAIAFPFQDDADVTIEKIDLAGNRAVLSYPGNYLISGAGSPSGGSFTLTVPALAGEKYRIVGTAIIDRLISVVRNGRFSSDAIDSDLDRSRIIQQEQERDIDRALKFDFGTSFSLIAAPIDGASLVWRLVGQSWTIVNGPDTEFEATAWRQALAEEQANRIAGDDALHLQIDGIVPTVTNLTAQAAASASSAATSEAAANQLVQAATAGFTGFPDGQIYDWGRVTETITYFNQNWGRVTDPVTP
ncbi:hypothetical protein LJR231_002269 [Phyllobacterium sp. LjRoot231]|uniref:hypothetical protein n=1 Tax=Phyllobacterium sp. LjRoot231 TaxID=3342289 RepID=UPI003ED14E04